MAKAEKIHFPDDFVVTDQLRQWALDKYYYYDLPDVMFNDFKRIYYGEYKFANWYRAYQNYIIGKSPAKRKYADNVWEKAIEKCKDKQRKETIKVPIPKIKAPPKPVNRDKAMKELKKARLILLNNM